MTTAKMNSCIFCVKDEIAELFLNHRGAIRHDRLTELFKLLKNSTSACRKHSIFPDFIDLESK